MPAAEHAMLRRVAVLATVGVCAAAAFGAVAIGGYLATKNENRYRYDPQVEAALLRHGNLVHRRSGTNAAGFEEYQITHLTVRVPGAASGDVGATRLVTSLRGEGWTFEGDPRNGYTGGPPDEPVAVAVEGFAAYLRGMVSDLTGEIADLRQHVADPEQVVIVTVEAQGQDGA